MGTIPVYNVVDYGAIGDGNPAHATVNTTAFTNALAAISGTNGPGILYVPPSAPSGGPNTQGFVVNNGVIALSQPNVILQGAGSMGSSGTGTGAGTSTIIGLGSGGSTIAVYAMGCEVRDLAFAPSGPQNYAYLYLSATQGQVRVDNVHMEAPNIGISLNIPAGTPGEYWIERVLIEGNIGVGGIAVNAGTAAVNLRHVIMSQYPATRQPQYGIQVTSAGELVICGGCDIISMGNCLEIVPGTNQSVGAVFVSDSLFDSGNGAGCVAIAPSGNGFVEMVRFSNVWASTGSNTTNTNGFYLNGTGSTAPNPIQDISLVNCLGQNFTNHDGLFAAGVNGLSVTSSTFGANYVGINIAAGTSNFILNGNKCGNYVYSGGNSYYGIIINPGASDHYVVMGNLLSGNGSGTLYDGGSGSNKAVVNNVG